MRPAPITRSTVPHFGWSRTVGRLALSLCLGEFPQQPQVAVPLDVPQRLPLRHQSALPWDAEFSGKVSAYFHTEFEGCFTGSPPKVCAAFRLRRNRQIGGGKSAGTGDI